MTLDPPCCTAARRTTIAAALSLVVLLAIGCQPQSPVAESAPAASSIELKPIEVAEAAAASPANYEQPAENAAMAAATTNFTNAAPPQAELPAAVSANAVPADATPTNATPAEPAKLAEAAPSLAGRDVWDTSYIQGAKVGYFHSVSEELEQNGRKLIKTTQSGQMTLRRYGQSVRQEVIYETVETPDGELVSFRSAMKSGPIPATCAGEVRDGKLVARINTFGKVTTKTLDWNPSWGGYFAAEQSSLRNPLQAGETRKMKALMAMSTDVAVSDIMIVADKWEKTKVLSDDRELLKSTVTSTLPGGASMTVVAWTDKSGEQIKQLMPGMQLETVRTSREVALGEPDDKSFDIGKSSIVKVAGGLADPHRNQRIVYQATTTTSDPAAVFAQGLSQEVKSNGKNSALITVRAVRPNSPEKLPAVQPQPTEDDLAPNNLVQSDDKKVVELANSVAPEETDPWKLALALEGYVHGAIEAKNFSQAFATAAEVAQSLEGDCTEHAVLLAGLCRARKIPARVAIGLVYYPPMKGFGYHMWNEVWINDRWVPLDSTLGLGGIGAAHLKLADSNLKGASGLATFLPVAQVMGQLKLEVVEVE